MTAPVWLAFLVAAGVGAPARFLVDSWVQRRARRSFPWGTLTVNATGCLAGGVLLGLSIHHGLGSSLVTVLGVGALGAYTTFSTFTVDTVRLIEQGDVEAAFHNVAATALAGFSSAALGYTLTAWF